MLNKTFSYPKGFLDNLDYTQTCSDIARPTWYGRIIQHKITMYKKGVKWIKNKKNYNNAKYNFFKCTIIICKYIIILNKIIFEKINFKLLFSLNIILKIISYLLLVFLKGLLKYVSKMQI